MDGLRFGLSLAFGLFGKFPNWLKKLPRSGGWLDTVKKILAFAELALAFKFLSNADLVEHWGILKREVFIAVWLIISIALAAYLFRGITIRSKISALRMTTGIIALIFSGYLILGLTTR